MAEVTWKGGPGNWSTGADWSTGSPPGAGDEALIEASGDYLVAVTSAISVGSIVINNYGTNGDNGATLDLESTSVTVSGNITIAGEFGVDENSGEAGSMLAVGGTIDLVAGYFDVGLDTGLSSKAGTTSVTAAALDNTGTVQIESTSGVAYSVVDIAGAVFNGGTINIDKFGGGGGSTLSIGGVLANNGNIAIGPGNDDLFANTTVSAGGLANTGTIELYGGGNGGTAQAILSIGAAAPGTLTGTYDLYDNALLEFAGGQINTIAGTLDLYGGNTSGTLAPVVADAGSLSSNSALSGLTSVLGTLWITDGETITTSGGLSNSGDLELDRFSGNGGSTLTVGGVLTNSNYIRIGATNEYLLANTTVSATGLANTGTIELDGGGNSGSTGRALLNVGSAAPGTLTGIYTLYDNAVFEFASGQIGTIAGTLNLYGGNTSGTLAPHVADAGSTTSNSALSGLTSVLGTLWITDGETITTSGGLSNSGDLELDRFSGNGGSTLTVGGVLTNSNYIRIGATNEYLLANTTVSATGLANTGTIELDGGGNSGSTGQALLNVGSAAPGTLTAIYTLNDNAVLEFASGQISTIAGTLNLYGGNTSGTLAPHVADAGSTTSNSALSGLTSVLGTLWITDGETITTSGGLSNSGDLELDRFSGNGGSTLTVGGVLTNSNYIRIGATNEYLLANTTVSATGLANTGTIELDGGGNSGSTGQALLNVGSAAPGTLTAIYTLNDNAVLEFASGQISTIAGTVELYGGNTSGTLAPVVADAGSTGSNSALSGLTSVLGTLWITDGETVTTSGGLSNSGDLELDRNSGDGGSTLTVGGVLTNSNYIRIGATNEYLLANTTVSATGLGNTGTIELDGGGASGSTGLALLTVGGVATNDGTIKLYDNSEIDVTGGNAFNQDAGSVTVGSGGVLVATTIDINGGLIDFAAAVTSGDGTGALNIGAAGTLEFGAGVDASHTATFTAATGTLELGSPASFSGTIAGFAGNDVVDLLNASVTGFSYSGNTSSGTLTISGSTSATLSFTGDYTSASFTTVSDGHGGTDIILTQPNGVVQWSNTGGGNWSSGSNWSGGSVPGAGNDAVIAVAGGYTVSLTAATTVNSVAITDANATLFIATPGQTETVSATVFNGGRIDVDTNGGAGGTTVDIGGQLANTGTLDIGNGSLSSATTVSAAGLDNTGTLNIQGKNGGGTLGTLDIGAAAGLGTAGLVTGTVNIFGDGLLEFASGQLTGILTGATLNIQTGIGYVADSGATTSNSALTGLTSNAGNFDLSFGAAVTTSAGFLNTGTVNLDNYAGSPGGSTLSIGGVLTNDGTMQIGTGNMTSATTVSAAGLDNTGTLNIQGKNGGGTLGTLDIGAAAGLGTAGLVTGTVNIFGDGLLEFASGQLTGILTGATLNIQTGIGYVADSGATTSNSALTGLTSNAGNFDLSFGAAVTTSAGFLNTGTVNLDNYAGSPGGSTLSIGGVLTNDGTMQIGTGNMTSATTVNATGLDNTGTLNIQGKNGGGTLGTLDIGAAAGLGTAGLVTGTVNIFGDGLLEFASGQLTGILTGATLNIQTGIGYVADSGATTSNSALTGLTSNAGNFDLSFGAAVTTSAGFLNTGTVNLDNYAGSPGGSTLSIGGVLTNDGTMQIGTGNMTSATTVNATGLDNTGTLNIQGKNGGGTLGTLDIGAAAGLGTAGVVTGTVNIFGDGLLEFASGQLTTIASGAQLNIQTGIGFVADSGATTSNSALTGLTGNAGNFDLSYGAAVTTSAGFLNTGTVNLDNYAGSPGGSTFTIGGVLTNDGTVNVAAGSISSATTITANGLANYGTINLYGDSTAHGALMIGGAAANDATLNLNSFAALTVTGGNSFTQAAGTTNLFGTLTAAAIDVTGGVLQGSGTVIGAVDNTGGTVEAESNGNPATLTVSGSYAESGGGVLEERLTGTGAGQAGLLAVTGPLELSGGTLYVSATGFSFAAGQVFTVATFQSGTAPGLFAHIQDGTYVGNGTSVDIGGGLTLGLEYNIDGGNIQLEVFNTPATSAISDAWLGGSGNWSTSGGWSNGVPLADSDVTIGQTSTGAVTLDTSATVNSLAVSSGNSLTFAASQSLVVGGGLTVTSGGTLTLAAGGDAVQAGSGSNAGDIEVHSAGLFAVDSAFTNAAGATINVDTAVAAGASKFEIAGTFANLGNFEAGANTEDNISAPTTVTVGGLQNISGALFQITGSPNEATTLVFSGGAGFSSNGGRFFMAENASATISGGLVNAVTGAISVDGNVSGGGSNLTISGTLDNQGYFRAGTPSENNTFAPTTVALGGLQNPFGGEVQLFGSPNESITLQLISGGAGFTSNGGDFELHENASATIAGNFINGPGGSPGAEISVDIGNLGAPEGGSRLTISGTLDNQGTFRAGSVTENNTLAPTTVALGGLINESGASFQLYGSPNEAITLNLLSGGSGFTSNAGDFELHENASLTLSGGLTNASTGSIYVDSGSAEGGSHLTVGGTLDNQGVFRGGDPLGNNTFAPTTVTLGGLTNESGASIALYGSPAENTTLTAPGGTNAGSITLVGNAVLGAGSLVTQSGGTILVSSGATASGGIVGNGGIETVSAGGTASGTIISASGTESVLGTDIGAQLRGGSETVSSGGLASAGTVSAGTLTVLAGGNASGTVLSGGSAVISAGGTASGTTISAGGSEGVLGTDIGAQLRGGSETVSSGGLASAGTVSAGTLTVLAGGNASGTTLSGGSALVSAGGTASATTILNGGSETVFGLDVGATISAGGVQTVSAGGVDSGATISSGGNEIVLTGGTASNTTAATGGQINVSSGGVTVSSVLVGSGGVHGVERLLSGAVGLATKVSSDGVLNVSAGGAASNTTVSSAGQLIITSGGVDSGATISSGGNEIVLTGGTASNTTAATGGQINVSSGGVTVSSVLVGSGGVHGVERLLSGAVGLATKVSSDGVLNVSAGGTASNTTVSSAGQLIITSGGVDSGATISSGGNEIVLTGGNASGTTLAGGSEIVSAGGTASGTIISAGGAESVLGTDIGAQLRGGSETVSSGGLASAGTVSAGTLTVLAGGRASGTMVAGYQDVFSGGTASGTHVLTGGREYVYTGGVASGTVVSSGGYEYVSSGGTASGTVVSSGGYEYVSSGGAASGTMVAGYQLVYSGGVASGATVLGGRQYVYTGGVASGTVVSSGGYEYVSSGGMASGTVVSSGGYEYVSSGGVASGATVLVGGREYVYTGGAVSGTVVSSGGYEYVSSGGLASGTMVAGYQLVYSGGVASGATVLGGGLQYVYVGGLAGGTVVSSGGYEYVSSGGVASGTMVTGFQDVFSGGIASGATVLIGGSATVYSGGSISGTTLLSGGTLELLGNAVNAAFTWSGGTLEIGVGYTLSSQGVGAGQTLVVLSGGTTSAETISGGGNAIVSAGGTASGAIVSAGGSESVLGSDIGTQLRGGSETVSGGGVASAGTVSAGTLTVLSGGVASGMTLSGGNAIVSAGGTASGTIVLAGGSESVLGSDIGVQLQGGNETVSAGGVVRGAIVSGGGSETVSSGGLASGTIVGSGGSQTVSSGGVASGTIVSSGGSETVSSGGLARGTIVGSGGKEIVSSGGVASGTKVSSGGTEYVYGSASATAISGGGYEYVSSGGMASGAVVSGGGYEYVSSGGVASGTVVAGYQLVLSGGVASGATVLGGGRQYVYRGGLASGTLVSGGGYEYVSSGGTAGGTMVAGYQVVYSGGAANGTHVLTGGREYVYTGGVASGTVVSSGGYEYVSSGGRASGTMAAGYQVVYSGGVASGATMVGGGRQYIYTGGVAGGTVVSSGGYENVSSGGTASGTVVSSGGYQLVYPGGVASGAAVLGGGFQYVYTGGAVVGTVVSGGGYEYVSSGGVASGTMVAGYQLVYPGGVASGATVVGGGRQYVYTGGAASGTVVSSGGYEYVSSGGVASGTMVAGYQLVYSGGVASAAAVLGGGRQYVYTGGAANGTMVSSGGYEYVSSGGRASGTVVSSGGYELVYSSGVASAATVLGGGQYVYTGGVASGTVVSSGGYQYVSSGGVASGTTVLSGGYELAQSGGVASSTTISGGLVEIAGGGSIGGGSITFAGGELKLDAAQSFIGKIAGFAVPDQLDLRDISFISGTTSAGFVEAAGNTSGTLTVTDGVHNANLTLLGLYTSGQFHVATDGSGGTLVTDPPVGGGSSTVTFDNISLASPFSGTTSGGYETTYAGHGQTGAAAFPLTADLLTIPPDHLHHL